MTEKEIAPIKTGLVLEGGGVRGIYTAGILDVFMEEGLRFDGVLGVSAGAIHGCSFLSNQKGRSIRYYKKYCKHYRFMSLRNWFLTGNVVDTKFCYDELPNRLDLYDYDAFNRSGVPFYVGCSNVETGEAELLHVTDMKGQIDCLRASASLPYFSKLVEIEGKKYLDGGCTDSVPVKAFQKMGYEKNVVILTREAAYQKSPELLSLAKIAYRKYPAFAEALCRRHTVYNHQREEISKMAEEGSIYLIRPKEALNIGRLEKDPENIQRVYDIGQRDAREHLGNLLDWLKN